MKSNRLYKFIDEKIKKNMKIRKFAPIRKRWECYKFGVD